MPSPRPPHTILLPVLGLACGLVLGHPSAASGQTPTEVEVSFTGGDPDVTLAGTLLLPAGAAPHPAVLFVTGTGDHTRDQIISGTPMFAELARALSRAGVASLRVDERGTGESTGRPWPFQTPSSRVGDMVAALEYLRGRPEVAGSRVGALGHSEGAEIVAEVASRQPMAFAILLSPPALPNRDIFLAQEMAQFGNRAAEGASRTAYREAVEALIALSIDPASQPAAFEDAAAALLVAAGQPADGLPPRAVQAIAGMYGSPWLREHLRRDPGTYLQQLDIPTLAIYGSADRQTVPSTNAPVLVRALLSANDAPALTLAVLPEQDHFSLRAPGRPPGEHVNGEMVLSQELQSEITRWLDAVRP